MALLLTERARSEKWLPQPRQVAYNEGGSIGKGVGPPGLEVVPHSRKLPWVLALGRGDIRGRYVPSRSFSSMAEASISPGLLSLHPQQTHALLVRKKAEKRRSETRAILVECCKGKLPDPAVEVVLDSLLGSVPLKGGGIRAYVRFA